MSFKKWKIWFKKLPWKHKWFIFLLLFRPLIDLTHDIEVLSSMTLLHIVGGFTFIIIIFLYILGKLSPKIKSASSISGLFIFWSLLLILNSVLILVELFTLDRLHLVLKLLLPAYLYLFFRDFINSKGNLDGTLQTILYSAIIPSSLLLYEILISPFRIVRSRGLERIMGGYPDVVSLALFFLGILLIAGYYIAEKIEKSAIKRKDVVWGVIVVSFCILGLLNINHTASYITFIFLLFFLFFSSLRVGKKGKIIGVSILVFSGLIIFLSQVNERIEHLLNTDIRVIRGEVDVVFAFHGRMGRWQRHWDYFSDNASFPEKLVGVIGVKRPFMISAGEHNDYLRILYATGYIGIFVYFCMLIALFKRSAKMPKSQQFLVKGMLLILLLMSVSTAPTFYNFINFLFIPIVAYTVLPKSIWKKEVVQA